MDSAGYSAYALGLEPDPEDDLSPIADQLMAIAGHLRKAAMDTAPAIPRRRATDHAMTLQQRHLTIARHVYALRRRRTTIFGNADLFGEPAWDMLLDLYIAHAEGKCVSVSSACIGSAAPATTGLRWLGILADEGLVVRENDPGDQRRVMVRLTAHGVAAMERFLETVDLAF